MPIFCTRIVQKCKKKISFNLAIHHFILFYIHFILKKLIQPISWGNKQWNVCLWERSIHVLYHALYYKPLSYTVEKGIYSVQSTEWTPLLLVAKSIEDKASRQISSHNQTVLLWPSQQVCIISSTCVNKYFFLIAFFFFSLMQCVPILGRGFETGGYKCECKQGYEYPFEDPITYFDGQLVEAEFLSLVENRETR